MRWVVVGPADQLGVLVVARDIPSDLRARSGSEVKIQRASKSRSIFPNQSARTGCCRCRLRTGAYECRQSQERRPRRGCNMADGRGTTVLKRKQLARGITTRPVVAGTPTRAVLRACPITILCDCIESSHGGCAECGRWRHLYATPAQSNKRTRAAHFLSGSGG